jgi:hypothetical protein
MACKPALIANAKSLSGCFINVLLLEIKLSEPHRELGKLRARIGLDSEISKLE